MTFYTWLTSLLLCLLIGHPAIAGQLDSAAWKPGARPPAAVRDHAQKLRPGLPLQYLSSSIIRGGDFIWSKYSYETPIAANKWPAGVLHVLWGRTSSTPVWSLDWGGDFQPHSQAWIDFDGDGHRDIFFLAGFEDVFATRIYLWKPKGSGAREDALVHLYSSDNDYSVLLDMEADGRPEILDSGHSGDAHATHQCGQDEWDRPEIPRSVHDALDARYRALSRGFDQYNFTYNIPDAYPSMSMKILDPIKILRIEKSGVVDVTAQYPVHLRWRLGVLREIRAANVGKCRDLVDSVISYLEKRLAKVQPKQAVQMKPDGGGNRQR